MLTFLDGPAAGKSMPLRRSPVYLRVVWAESGKWDGLDQIEDTPDDGEEIFVYSRPRGPVGVMHIDYADRRASEWLPYAAYRLHTPQPAEWQMRDTEAWQAWCREQAGKAEPIITEPTCSSFCHPQEPCWLTESGACDANLKENLVEKPAV